MTNEDVEAAADLLEEEDAFRNPAAVTHHKLATKVAGKRRNRHYEINAAFFLRVMLDLGCTFVWEDGPHKGHKFGSVFEALAAKMPRFEELGLTDRAEHIEEYAPKLQAGFYAARKYLDQWCGATIYAVPQDTESGRPTVITLDPNFRTESGKTVAQMQEERDLKLANGQVRASSGRLVASIKDKSVVENRMTEMVRNAMEELRNKIPALPSD